MLPIGKLSPEILTQILDRVPISDPRLILGPGIGLDCAVLALEDTCLVFKSDPITFTTDEIGWYAVQINANDIATTGAIPRWFLATVLLPEGITSTNHVKKISEDMFTACRSLEISVIGGHTEITYGLDRPIIAGTMIGEVSREKLITPKGASPGDHILLTKGVPIEGTAILAREFSQQLQGMLTNNEIQTARNFLYEPGISVLRDARLAIQAGKVTAMHDPTEGGLAGALWELAEACEHTLIIDTQAVIIPPISKKICDRFGINPLETIASGALLLTVSPDHAHAICHHLQEKGLNCKKIGVVEAGEPQVLQKLAETQIPLQRPEQDAITRLF